MRLGQLARQLEIKPEKIVTYLKKEKQIEINPHPNSKIDDELVNPITTHFKPVQEESEPAVEEKKSTAKTSKKKEEKQKKETAADEKLVEHIETPSTNIEGPKIIGKIDLPDKSNIQVEVDGVVYDQEFLDKKKKDEQKAERERKAQEKEQKRKEEQERKQKELEQKRIEQERQAMLAQEKHNILTAEEERKRAVIEKAIRDREARLEEKRKERQKKFYEEQIAAKIKLENTEKNKKKVVPVQEIQEEKVVNEVKETNLFKRFIKWLNT